MRKTVISAVVVGVTVAVTWILLTVWLPEVPARVWQIAGGALLAAFGMALAPAAPTIARARHYGHPAWAVAVAALGVLMAAVGVILLLDAMTGLSLLDWSTQ
jgi:hypothetical protein